MRLLTDAAPLLIASLDLDLILRFANLTCANWWQCIPGEPIDHCVDVEAFAILEPLLAEAMNGQASTTEHDMTFADGRHRYVQISCVPRRQANGPIEGAVLVMTDLTDRRRAEEALQRTEEQLRHAQKMDAVGRLAGGIAHDFNNLLTAINGYCDLILAVMRTEEPFHAHIEEIRRAGERAATLTGQLLAFSRKQISSPRVLDLNGMVKDLERMLRRLIGEDVVLSTDLRARQAWVLADPSHVEQVVLNLILNARDAMPDGGSIAIETEVVDVRATDAAGYLVPAPGPYVRLTVRDTGTGIAPELLPHLFEPFFSTKGKGKASSLGLGLSTVYGIVRQGHGGLRVHSMLGHGAAFEVMLPLTQPEARVSVVKEGTEHDRASLPGGSERVLLVEDEPAVRRLVARILRGLGYDVHEAGSGAEAMREFQHCAGRFDVLLTDVVMPGMNGRELAQALVLQKPRLLVLFMSGYAQAMHPHAEATQNSPAFILKPFTLAALARRLRELLDEGPRAQAAIAAPM